MGTWIRAIVVIAAVWADHCGAEQLAKPLREQ